MHTLGIKAGHKQGLSRVGMTGEGKGWDEEKALLHSTCGIAFFLKVGGTYWHLLHYFCLLYIFYKYYFTSNFQFKKYV